MPKVGAFDFMGREIGGWRRVGAAKVYSRETIFDYIDGAGEVYRLYDFREVAVFHFRKAGCEPVVVEIFDMGTAGDAYGIFTFYHQGKDVAVGQGAYLRSSLLSFWQDRYFVCVSTESGAEPEESILLNLAQPIAAAIPGKGSLPEWLKSFPGKDRRAQSIRYFHNQPALNYHLFISEKNILNLDEKTQCALANYRAGNDSFAQLWVRYPDSSAAQAGHARFMKNYTPVGKLSGPVRDKKKKWMAATWHGQFVAIVFGAPTRADADSVTQAAERTLREVAR